MDDHGLKVLKQLCKLTLIQKIFEEKFRKISEEIKTFSEVEKSSKINIEILGQSDAACQNAKTKFEEILNEFIKKDEISNETVELLTRDQISSLSTKYKDCKIVLKNKKIFFHGYKDDIINAKLEVIGLINELVHKRTNNYTEFPKTWVLTPTNQTSYDLINLNVKSAEYLEIHADFMAKSNNKGFKCIKIERIQNQTLFRHYSVFKDSIGKKCKNNINEKFLFHGTDPNSIDSICKFGFNRSYCGVNGVAYGQGVYFAVNSHYSDSYAKSAANRIKQMFRVQVIAGESCLGNPQMKVPPRKFNGDQFDSTTDPSFQIFVCYHDSQCYPEYLITYC